MKHAIQRIFLPAAYLPSGRVFSSFLQSRSMSTMVTPPATPSASALSSQQPANISLKADAYRKQIRTAPFNLEAIYGLALCIAQGAPIQSIDLRYTKFQNRLNSTLSTVSRLDLEAELYRTILKINTCDNNALLGLAKCLQKGATPRAEDLRGTWLQDGNWQMEDKWGLSKPVITLLIKAIEQRVNLNIQRSKPLPNYIKKQP